MIGGLNQWATLRDGTPEQAVAEVEDAIAQTGGVGLIVGPGCVLPMETPDANVAAVVAQARRPAQADPRREAGMIDVRQDLLADVEAEVADLAVLDEVVLALQA